METRKRIVTKTAGVATGRRPTPIWIPKEVRTALVLCAVAGLAILAYAAPAVPLVAVRGLARHGRRGGRYLSRHPATRGEPTHAARDGRGAPHPPVFILLAVIGGGQLARPVGIVLAVPALAVGRVLLDFARPRLRIRPRTSPARGSTSDG